MERHDLPNGGDAYVSKKGRVGIWLPVRGVLVVQLRDHGDGELAGPVIEAIDESLRRAERVRLFYEAEKLRTYDSALRKDLTHRMRTELARIDGIHVLVASKMVALGVSVASVLLEGKVTSHSDPRPFFDEVKIALTAGGLTAFPLEVFSAR